jgi:hypothetical protein
LKKLVLFLAVSLFFASCGSMPKTEVSNLQNNLTGQDSAADIPESDQEQETLSISDDSPELTESLEPVDLFTEDDLGGFPEPILELAETDYPSEIPEEGSFTVTEEPIAQQPPAPVPPPPAPVPPPPPTPPPEQITPPVVQQEPPPPESPEPEKEPSVPQRETPSYVIPDMPFQPVTVIPDTLPIPHSEGSPPDPTEGNLPYSRTIRAMVGQFIEIPFRGAGWVYLGEFGSRRGVSYDSRRMDQEGMTFIFRADTEGTYSLRFNRHDFVRDSILNDYVRIIVEQRPPATGSSWSNSQIGPERVYAEPRWPLATEPEGRTAQGQTAGTQQQAEPGAEPAGSAPADTVPANTSPAGSAITDTTLPSAAVTDTAVPQVEDWLKKAREEYNAGRIKNALDALDQFMILYPAGNDEAFWLYGQSLEANNEATRDIRLSLDYYRRLTREFPLSNRYNEARQRIAYLERFYFNIQ